MGITKADTVKLISAEGFEFVIHREAAMISNTLKNMLSSSGEEPWFVCPASPSLLH
jgi:hypothetical protein